MKAYTDIKQSKKLAEILQPESADMCWGISDETLKWKTFPYLMPWRDYTAKEHYLPCWSLAALIEAMPEILIETVKARDGYDGYYYFVTYEEEIGVPYEKELIDACYEMILRLHEQKLI